MQLNTNRYALAVRPPRLAAAAGDVSGYFAHGNPAKLVPWTPVMSDFLNDWSDEFKALLAFAGLQPSGDDLGQMLKAVQHLLFEPTFLGGFASITARDNAGNGGLLKLVGSGGNNPMGSVILDNVDNYLRVYTDNGTIGLSYNTGSYTLKVGNGTSGHVSTVFLTLSPDVNGNRIAYFVDSVGNQTGHILQDNTGGSTSQAGTTTGNGAIHINPTGGAAEVVIDTSGGLTATALYVDGGEISNFQGLVGTANSAAEIGTGGISTTGPGSFTKNIDFLGKNLTFYNPQAGAPNNRVITAQFVYNDVTPQTDGPQTEIWCEGAKLWLDSGGGLYVQSGFGTANSKLSSVNTTPTSEKRFKRDIEPLSDGLAALQAVPPLRFRYTEESGEDPELQHVGHLYEDLLAAMPEATLRVGDRGQADPRFVVPYLHSAVLQLSAENAALRDRMSVLEARLPPRAG